VWCSPLYVRLWRTIQHAADDERERGGNGVRDVVGNDDDPLWHSGRHDKTMTTLGHEEGPVGQVSDAVDGRGTSTKLNKIAATRFL